MSYQKSYDVVVIGGFGHVGLPLALMLANKGKRVCCLDKNKTTLLMLSQGKMPFMEKGADSLLKKVSRKGNLTLSIDPSSIGKAPIIIFTVGTPVDRHLNPEFDVFMNVIDSYQPFIRNGQLLIIRSTVYPGTTQRVKEYYREKKKSVDVAFCPERIAEGKTLKELVTLPQIVSSFTHKGVNRAKALFQLLTRDVVILEPLEAEMAKLFTNVYRYIKFSIANQFFMMATSHGADFSKIHQAMTYNYERAKDMPSAGFAAGPCLFKDTMQLASFTNNSFPLGHVAMLVNEGLPNFLVEKLKIKFNLKKKTVGILGMAYKPEIDDPRESLSYKLRAILEFECKSVLCTDVYIKDERFVSEKELIERSDIIILATPHRRYNALKIPSHKFSLDIWNRWGKGCLL